MRVLLLNPPAPEGVKLVREGRCMQRMGAWTAVWAPVSLALTGALLLEKGHEVILHDCIVEEIDTEGVVRIAGEFKPELVVVNAVTPSIDSDLGMAAHLKAVLPSLHVTAFGIHVTVKDKESLEKFPELDSVIRGEPETAAAELAESLSKGGGLGSVKGITFRENGKIVRNAERPPLESLDELPFPAWQLIRRDLYRMPFSNKEFLLVPTGRGCPHKCRFCADPAFYGHKLIIRTPSRVVDEMEWVKKEFGIEDFLFWSESFTLNPKYAQQVAEEMIRRNTGFRWVCNSRVDNVNEEMLRKFKQAGCWMIGYGIEVGSQRILDLMNKRTTLDQARNAVEMARKAGLEVTGHCVVGYPGETREEIIKTIEFAKELDLDFAQFYCVVPFPGSELYEQAIANGWIINHDWTQFEQNFSVITTEQLSADEVMALRRKAYKSFYLRPRMVWKTLKRVRSYKEFSFFVKMAKEFVTWV